MRQGKKLLPDEVKKIIVLLKYVDIDLKTIALRFGCSHSQVAAINKKFNIRQYGKNRSQWSVSASC